MRSALICPGQGAQQPGMLGDLAAAGTDVLDEAAAVLGEDVTTLDTADALRDTRAVQLALLICGVTRGRALLDAGAPIDYLAGHSVGQWTAAVLADVVDVADAVRIVDLRAHAMAAAAPPDSGMIAVEGVGAGVIDESAARLRGDGELVWLSNINSASAATASGTHRALARLAAELTDVHGARIRPLEVSVPAHTELMAPAGAAVATALDDIELRRPRIPIAGNRDGRLLRTPAQLRTDLTDGIVVGVRWDLCVDVLAGHGTRVWLHNAPGRSLLATLPPDHHSIAVDEVSTDRLVRWAHVRRR
ncbi:acyltransferase domain-containing protein [Gordonia sp. CPCC 205515]|uniref:ACP S-malonyltransferase n=1 Tax=Gordonia sp. CPCC 205515 TaxID=3140791 RepID=UPI003AF3CE4C